MKKNPSKDFFELKSFWIFLIVKVKIMSKNNIGIYCIIKINVIMFDSI